MSYLVLARKYRPQRFAELVGQEHVARTLGNAIEQHRVHHAFLFTGARGVGKTSAARILAKSLCCVRGPTIDPCGVCDACQEIAGGRSVDIIEIDGASNTGVDDVRALREGARYMPSKAPLKIYIIDEVHMLSTSAFNALLKTLEEPPAHVVFIFATTEVHKIPSTILSRCQRYDFKLIPTPRLVAHLEGILAAEGIAFEPSALRVLARQAAGSVRDALSLLDQVIAYVGPARLESAAIAEVLGIADRALLLELARAVKARQVGQALRVLASAVDRGVDVAQLARAFLGLLRDLELASRISDGAVLGQLIDASPDELAELSALAEPEDGPPATGRPAGPDLFSVWFDRWARAVDESSRSTTPRLLLEMALVDLCQAEPLEPLGDLLERLEGLEARLRNGGGPGAPSPRSAGGGGGGSGPERGRAAPPAPAAPGARVPTAAPGGPGAPSRSASDASWGESSDPGDRAGASGAGPDALPWAPATGTLSGDDTAAAVVIAPVGAPVASPSPSPVSPVPAFAAVPTVGAVPAEVRPSPRSVGLEPQAAREPQAAPTELWRRVRQELERRRPRVGALLANAHVLEIDESHLVLGFGDRADADAGERVRGDIEQALATEWHRPVRLQVRHQASTATAPPVVTAEAVEEAALRTSDRRSREEEARRHPMIQRVQDLFGVGIREIKNL